MSKTYEVLSAFLDDEPFDPQDLAEALTDEAGRALLIDLMALRRVVQPLDPSTSLEAPRTTRASVWRIGAIAAALFLAIAGGYVAGSRSTEMSSPDSAAPPATRVVEAVPFVPTGGPQ